MNTDNFIWTDEDVAEHSLKSRELTLFQFKWKKIQEKENIEKYTSKPKEVLYITEDGRIVYERDTFPVYKVDKSFQIIQIAACDASGTSNTGKYFSNKEKAEDWILMNKQCLSINDIKWWLEKYFNYPDGINASQLKELAKSKL